MKLETVAGTAPVILPKARAPTPRRFARQSRQPLSKESHMIELTFGE
jgi:hypothetical protein